MKQHAFVATQVPAWPHLCVECAFDKDHPAHRLQDNDSGQSTVEFDWSAVDDSVVARVARGMAHLRDMYPDALLRIDIDALDIGDGDFCVLGQLWGKYNHAPETVTHTPEWRQAHGFQFAEDDEIEIQAHDYALNVEWRTSLLEWLGDSA